MVEWAGLGGAVDIAAHAEGGSVASLPTGPGRHHDRVGGALVDWRRAH